MMKAKTKKAFTLIELMVVLLIITVLVGITIPVSRHISARAQAAMEKAQRVKIESALEDYRAKYGEYPITPTHKGEDMDSSAVDSHYPPNGFLTECYLIDTNAPYSVYTNVNKSSEWPPVEVIAGDVRLDYSLTYPLMLRQIFNQERPLMEFPYATIAYVAWTERDLGERTRTIWTYDSDGIPSSASVVGIRGAPINRPVALNPKTGHQIEYTSNGWEYYLNFP